MTASPTLAQHKLHHANLIWHVQGTLSPVHWRASICVACAAMSGTVLTTCGPLQGTLFPMCGMNLAFDRQLIGPAMYFGLMGDGQPIGRYDDMWAGWCCKVGTQQLLLLVAPVRVPAFRICCCCGYTCWAACQGAVYLASCPWLASVCHLLLRARWWAPAALCRAPCQTMWLASIVLVCALPSLLLPPLAPTSGHAALPSHRRLCPALCARWCWVSC